MNKRPRFKPALVSLASALLLSSCIYPRYPGETIRYRAWNAGEIGREGTARERLYPELDLDEIRKKEDIGIAFSGGGNRAATAALGQVRGLEQIGLMSRVRYISSVSGGTWFAAPYCFLQPPAGTAPGDDTWVHAADRKFLGPYVAPQDLTLDKIQEYVPGTFAGCAMNAHFVILRIFKLRGDKNWAYTLAGVYLDPLRMGREEDKFIAYDRQSAREIADSNNGTNSNAKRKVTERDFIWCAPHRPYLIAGATLAQPWDWAAGKRYYPIQLTPNYIGTSGEFPIDDERYYMGGGYVQSAGYDSFFKHADGDASGAWTVTGRLPARRWPLNCLSSPRFSLNDLMATSGAAPTVPFPEFSWVVGFPEFQHWAPGRLGSGARRIHTFEKVHTDGGGTDDSGVAALVARGVPTIIAFVNSQMQLDQNNQPRMPDDVNFLFGKSASPAQVGTVGPIFDPGQYDGLVNRFDEAWKDGKAPVITTDLDTVDNRYFNIVAKKHAARVTWVFLGPPASTSWKVASSDRPAPGSALAWYANLNADTKMRMTRQWGREFADFPYYKTFFENPPGIIWLSPEQVNALSQFTAYVVLTNKEKLLRPK